MSNSPSRRRLPVWKRLVYGLIPAVVLVGIGEAAARLFHDPAAAILGQPLAGNRNLGQPDFFVRDERLFWALRPNLARPLSSWGDVSNSRGFRNFAEPRSANTGIRVLCLGDSVTYGFGLPVDHAYPTVLAARTGFEVLNASCPGYSSWQGVQLFGEKCADLAPDVVVLQYGANDNSSWVTKENGRWLALSDAERARHVAWHDTGSALLRWLRSLRTPPALDVSDLPDPDVPARVGPEEFRANLLRLAEEAPKAYLLVWPTHMELDPRYVAVPTGWLPDRYAEYQRVARELSGNGIEVLDVVRLFREAGHRPADLMIDVIHPSPLGARLVAEALAEKLRSLRPAPSR